MIPAAFLAFAAGAALAQNPDPSSQHLSTEANSVAAKPTMQSCMHKDRCTTFRIALSSPIKAASLREEQEFTAETIGDFEIVDLDSKAILIPSGSSVAGRIATKYPDDGFSLIFDSIMTPCGKRKLGNGNLCHSKGKVRVERSGKPIFLSCKVFPGLPPGSTVSTAIGAVAAPADGKDLIYASYGGALGNPFRTAVVLKKRDLNAGDVLEIGADYFDIPDRFGRSAK